jgi:hypothetical protein
VGSNTARSTARETLGLRPARARRGSVRVTSVRTQSPTCYIGGRRHQKKRFYQKSQTAATYLLNLHAQTRRSHELCPGKSGGGKGVDSPARALCPALLSPSGKRQSRSLFSVKREERASPTARHPRRHQVDGYVLVPIDLNPRPPPKTHVVAWFGGRGRGQDFILSSVVWSYVTERGLGCAWCHARLAGPSLGSGEERGPNVVH